MGPVSDSFPRQYARTQRLTLGEPRNLALSADGSRLVFLRSRSGDDALTQLWCIEVGTGSETCVADPAELTTGGELSDSERRRRERLREGAAGITAFSLDRAGVTAAFALDGGLYVADLVTHTSRRIEVPGPIFDPRISPDGSRIAYVSDRSLWITDLDGNSTELASDEGVSWGQAEFIASEEFRRYRGMWWSPDSAMVAACRVDETPVDTIHISDPAHPAVPPRSVRYPAAGTPNATVTLHLLPLDGAPRQEVTWDHDQFSYLATVNWNHHGLAVTVISRDQRDLTTFVVDPTTATTTTVLTDHRDDWIDLVPGTGVLVDPDTVIMATDHDGSRRLIIGDQTITDTDLHVMSVVSATAEQIVFTAQPIEDATVTHLYRWSPERGVDAITSAPGVHSAVVGSDTIIVGSTSMDAPGRRWQLPHGRVVSSRAEAPLIKPNVILSNESFGAMAVVLPRDHDGSALPVLMDPYGGPLVQRVIRSANAWYLPQWFADQGFAVVVADGRGTPGRGTAHERAVFHDLATGVLDDQVTALHLAAERHPELDLERVGIRGWSFGGYLAALAVLQRPDVFHAAVAGAPVTEWRFYDTAYTERYLGDPRHYGEVYDSHSLISMADQLTRPLLLIHGLADDNVLAAHTLGLSSALLAAGRPHEVLPLVGVTHMTPQEVVAENLILHQLDFLRRHLT
ncbi:MAG: S9 family peptidase [Ilumatobacter coccineus]|uniref:S9 family peptidase n=1 Tax=Ilumatobacter coccineus TaxID=467094 RepID=A0A2G6K6Z1_9ACTN|nr:MAG: S9 family peptidase [Ilumatobacter coccineus]